MTGYIVRRIVRAIVLLVVVTVLSFFLFTVLPEANTSPHGGSFLDYLKAIFLHFNFGYSDRDHQSVLSLVVGRLPATLSLIAGAGLLSVALAIPVGILAAVRRGTRFDRVAMGAALGVVSMPVFWLGLILLYLLASDIGDIPIFPGANSYAGLTADPGKWFTSLILPWLVLGAAMAAIYSRLLRGRMLAVMGEDYVRSARARGVAEQRLVRRHGAVAAVAGLVAVVGFDIGALLGGAVLTETAFRIHGVGLLGYDAVRHSDYATVQGTVLLAAMLVVVVNLVLDVGFAWLDPRVSVA
ncbi:MAG: ABC transporter permease [Actinomycetota bacterium]|nr:ABC transporter permease [Actinomycetota bacterium]